MINNHKIIENNLNMVITILQPSIPSRDFTSIKEYVDVGEYGLCLETICAIIYEDNIPISTDVYQAIVKMGELMQMDPINWRCLMQGKE